MSFLGGAALDQSEIVSQVVCLGRLSAPPRKACGHRGGGQFGRDQLDAAAHMDRHRLAAGACHGQRDDRHVLLECGDIQDPRLVHVDGLVMRGLKPIIVAGLLAVWLRRHGMWWVYGGKSGGRLISISDLGAYEKIPRIVRAKLDVGSTRREEVSVDLFRSIRMIISSNALMRTYQRN